MTNANNIAQLEVDMNTYPKMKPRLLEGIQMSEKQITKRATHQSVEEFYTFFDFNDSATSLDHNMGYPFDYPYRWLTDESQDKRIGIRRLEVTPSSHSILISVVCFDHLGNALPSIEGRMDITPENDIIEIMHLFVATFSPRDQNGNLVGTIRFEYNEATAILDYWYEEDPDNIGGISIQGLHFMGEFTSVTAFRLSELGIMEFMRMLNIFNDGPLTHPDFDPQVHDLLQAPSQIIGDFENVVDNMQLLDLHLYPNWYQDYMRIALPNIGAPHRIVNVWSRKALYFHASFSTSKRKIIGKRGDWYPSPSLWYPSPTNENTFYIQLSTDSNHKIPIRYCNIDIQLCFSYH